jgi:hypothetical protein
MKPKLENYGQLLRLTQSGTWTPTYNLSLDGRIVMSMHFLSGWHSGAMVESAGKKWILNQKSPLSWSYNITDSGSGVVIGETRKFILKANEIEILTRAKYTMHNTNLWGTKWSIADIHGRTLVEFSPFPGSFWFFKNQTEVRLALGSEQIPDIYLIIGAAWHLKLMERRAASVIAASS